MKRVELYGQVRRAVYVEGLSRREAARRFGIDPRTVAKMLAFSVPPGYRRSRPPARPKLDPFLGIIDRILDEDKLQPAKQQHTSKRIFERRRDEHGYAGGITIVKDYVHQRRLGGRSLSGSTSRWRRRAPKTGRSSIAARLVLSLIGAGTEDNSVAGPGSRF